MTKSMATFRKFIPACGGPLVLAFLVVLFYWKVIFGHSIFVFVDASRFFYPLWKWGSDVLKRGWIPLWNPDAQFGTPYFADPQMAYAYPPVPLLYALLSPVNAFSALIILHHFWALLGFWAFARHEGFSGKASLLGSLVFGFSLHVVCSSWTPVALLTISWIPWVFYSVEKILQGEKGGFLFLSLAWAPQLAAGYPVLVYLTVLAVGMHLIWRFITIPLMPPLKKRGWGGIRFWPCFGKMAAAGLVALAYNLVWGLPFADFFRLSNYENGAGRFQDLGWLDFGTLLSPFDQGHPLLPGYHGPHYWVSTYFVGLPALGLLFWGAYRKAYKKASWGILLVLSALSLGVLGISGLLRGFFPGYSLVIHSGYWLALLIFWVAWLVAESSQDFLERTPSFKEGTVWAGFLVLIFTAAFFLSYSTQAPFSTTVLGISFILAALAPFLGNACFRWLYLVAALALSLGSAAYGVNILLDKSYYEKPPSTLALLTKPGRLFFTPPLLRQAVVLQGANMEQAYGDAKEKLYPNWPLGYGMEEAPIYNTLQLKGSFAWTFGAFQYSQKHSRNVLDYLGIRYVIGKNDFKDFKSIHSPSGPIELSENPSPMPKWFSVGRAVPGGASLEGDFATASKTSMNYSKECFVGDPALAGNYQKRRVNPVPGTGRPNQVVLLAPGTGKALLASSETAYPGWLAFTPTNSKAGAPSVRFLPVVEVNHSFRGVVLREGENTVEFLFSPVTFRLGLFCSLVVCALWSLGIFRSLWARDKV